MDPLLLQELLRFLRTPGFKHVVMSVQKPGPGGTEIRVIINEEDATAQHNSLSLHYSAQVDV